MPYFIGITLCSSPFSQGEEGNCAGPYPCTVYRNRFQFRAMILVGAPPGLFLSAFVGGGPLVAVSSFFPLSHPSRRNVTGFSPGGLPDVFLLCFFWAF